MKKGSRILGIDDGPRELEKLIGVLYRGTEFIEQVKIIDQKPDTGNGTQKLVQLADSFDQYIEAIIIDGVSFNGFNIADISKISEKTDTPVIAVTTNKPSRESMKKGLNSADLNTEIIERLPEVKEIEDGIYIQFSGCSETEASNIVKGSTVQGKIPEAVRSAHLIGSGLK